MEPTAPKESIVSRLFGFGRRRAPEETAPAEAAAPAVGGNGHGEEESGFARTDGPAKGGEVAAEIDLDADEPRITVPEQVIRIRGVKRRDEVVTAIGDSFRELTGLLTSVSDRLDRQDSRTGDLADQLREVPEYLRALPRLHEENNQALRTLGERVGESNEIARAAAHYLARIPEVAEEQARAVHGLGEKIAEGTEAVHGVADAIARIPDEIRERALAQEEALRQVATAQQQTAKVMHVGHQKSLQLFHQATKSTLESVQRTTRQQRQQMEQILQQSAANMKRMFVLAACFMGATVLAVVALLFLR